MTQQRFRPPTPQSLQNGLGTCGHAELLIYLWRSHGLLLKLPHHPPTWRQPPISTCEFYRSIVGAGIAAPFTDNFGAPTFLVYKFNDTAQLICDFRCYNQLFTAPPSFRLPQLETRFSLHLTPPLYFVKLDLVNCFWSIRLPREVTGAFAVRSTTAVLQLRCFPFGWAWSPLLATCFVRKVLRPVARLVGANIWQFIDDILLADADPHFLRYCIFYAIYLLEKRGFLINTKSVTVLTCAILC